MQIDLSNEEHLELQYHEYAFNGMFVAMHVFSESERPYNEEHFQQFLEKYIQIYRELQECLYGILANHGIKNVPLKNLEYRVSEKKLIL